MTFGLVKHNNNSISAVTSVGLTQGKMTLIKEQTASSSASISFVDGSGGVTLDNTYPIYIFKFINIHPATEGTKFMFNASTDGGSNYNVTKTTTAFRAYHLESGSANELSYLTGYDLAQSTSDMYLNQNIGNADDSHICGTMFLFSPSDTTFVKHFMNRTESMNQASSVASTDFFSAGYLNTASAVDAIIFKMVSGNIDSGTIKLYGIKGS